MDNDSFLRCIDICLCLWDEEEAKTERVELVLHISPKNETTSSIQKAQAETPASKQGTASSDGGADFDKGCSDLCTKREASRKERFGGDLLDFQDIVRLAEVGHEKTISRLRQDYSEYFDLMFIDPDGTKNTDGGTHYFGMRPADLGGPSRERIKAKIED